MLTLWAAVCALVVPNGGPTAPIDAPSIVRRNIVRLAPQPGVSEATTTNLDATSTAVGIFPDLTEQARSEPSPIKETVPSLERKFQQVAPIITRAAGELGPIVEQTVKEEIAPLVMRGFTAASEEIVKTARPVAKGAAEGVSLAVKRVAAEAGNVVQSSLNPEQRALLEQVAFDSNA
eukprot:3578643-Prymnesium_polylepis.1